MFLTIKDLIEDAENNTQSLAVSIMNEEMADHGMSREEMRNIMLKQRDVMMQSITRGIAGVHSKTGLTGNDAKRMHDYLEKGETLCGGLILNAVQNAIATNEVNAAMGRICATPTAGSAGVVPGVLKSLVDAYNLTDDQQVDFLFVAGGFGLVVANNASIAGATGGCQAEVGSAAAMASAATVAVLGGSPQQAGHAFAMTIKNMLGLVCDPVAGLVEVPCVKRNALGASQALVSADMALAGIQSLIPADEVVEAMYQVGNAMPSSLRETGLGGLAMTETGKVYAEKIFGKK